MIREKPRSKFLIVLSVIMTIFLIYFGLERILHKSPPKQTLPAEAMDNHG